MLYWTKENIITERQKYLRRKILDYSFELKLSHIGSCLAVIDIVDEIYNIKKQQDIFVLSNGHAGIALYTVLIDLGIMPLRYLKSKDFNIHPDRKEAYGLSVSTGSLGQGVTIALGMAIKSPQKTIYCCLSDGEATEGSVWESLRIAVDHRVSNLVFIFNINGYSAYDQTNNETLISRIKGFGLETLVINGHNPVEIKNSLTHPREKSTAICALTCSEQFPFLTGIDAHYKVLSQDDYDLSLEILK